MGLQQGSFSCMRQTRGYATIMHSQHQRIVAFVVTLVIISAALVIFYDRTAPAYVRHHHVRHTNDVILMKGVTLASQDQHDTSTRNSFISHVCWGRLGNLLFQYAAVYCIAKRNNLIPLFLDPGELEVVENPGTVVNLSVYWPKVRRAHQLFERYCCSYDDRFERLSNNHNYSLGRYLQSWRYFEPCKEDVLRIVTFKNKYVEEANTILRELRQKMPNTILVGVHVRMEDHTSRKAMRNGKKVAPPGYYARAMTYFRDRFHDVKFIVITSSQEWWLSNVTRSDDVMFLNRSEPAVDMEVLSDLDHIIISVGTFGWWAAYRNSGTVVIFNDFYRPGSVYGNKFVNNATDYIYPGWVRM